MTSTPPVPSPRYAEYTRLLRELHALNMAGEGDSGRADEVRDAMDGPWHGLTRDEAARARDLSADLNSIGEVGPIEVDARAGRDHPDEPSVESLRLSGEWVRVLERLRGCPGAAPPHRAALLRWECWWNLGDPESALLFLREAVRLGGGSFLGPDVMGPGFSMTEWDVMLLNVARSIGVGRALDRLTAWDPDEAPVIPSAAGSVARGVVEEAGSTRGKRRA